MLSHMRRSLIVPVLVGLSQIASVATAAAATVGCPPTVGGHHLRRTDGGSLYLGRPEDNVLQTPATTQQGPNGSVNTWRFGNAENLTLVCQYEGTQTPVVVRLLPGMQSCRQEARTSSFACQ
jgi:hypothetical protein